MIIVLFIFLNIFLAVSIAFLVRRALVSIPSSFLKLQKIFRRYDQQNRKPPYPLELYVWVTSNDKHVCPDCIRRSKLRPMDIAEWMKIGLPGTPESRTCCEHECRCRLMPYKMTNSYHL